MGPVVVSSVAPKMVTVGTPSRGCGVHGAGIVGEEEAAGGGEIEELAQAGFAGEVTDAAAGTGEIVCNGLAESAFGGRAEDQESIFFRKLGGAFGEAFGEPSLGVAVGGAGADADDGAVDSQGGEVGRTGDARVLDAIEPDGAGGGETLHHTSAAEEFQVVEAFVAGDVARLGHRNGAGEQDAAAVAGIADALGDAGQPGNQRGVEGVLEQDGAIEALGAEAGGKFAAGAEPFKRRIGDDGVDGLFAGVEVGQPGAAQHGEVGVGKNFTNGTDGGQGHHGVAQPVCGAHEYLRAGRGVEGH